ncbi:septum formation family protein [Gordonia sp. ABSL1-1]|uniref:septum formation family protein n=1 Tax=Gordonia sp. ABSL1-1 TaxID=3053923 RepID=UPI002573484C|nr:septum formation family protein [Gordonia sp. ABSL1-1]MDL9937628.1 septum formation family protein [Gordonia sp. ABSL1-1]
MNADDERRDAGEASEQPIDPTVTDDAVADSDGGRSDAALSDAALSDEAARAEDDATVDEDEWSDTVDEDDVPDEPADPETTDAPSGWRDSVARNPIRLVLAAVVVGALVMGAIAFAVGLFDDSGSVGDSDIGERERLAENAFTKSVAGDCLDWPAGNPGQPVKVPCEQKHRFEVAGPVDTAVIPGAEFGDDAPWPGAARFATIRDEQCQVLVDQYLGGRLDPQGRFAVGLMNPSQYQWERGARELRCGLQETGPDGLPLAFSGRVADQNQSRIWPEGTCIGIIAANRKPTGFAVDCAEPHAFQTTGIVDLAVHFGDRLAGKPWPNTKAQNDYLQGICPGQAERFAGGKAKLDATTLNVQWSVLSEQSWLAGSRKVVCYLGLPDKRGGFATLVGDPRQGVLLINGKAPVAPPQAPPGRALPTPVPLPPGVAPNPVEVPAPAG